MSTNFLKTAGVLAVLFLGGMAVQAQTVSGTPAGAPVYKDTGAPEADNARYQEAKQAWILANPAAENAAQPKSFEEQAAEYDANKLKAAQAAELQSAEAVRIEKVAAGKNAPVTAFCITAADYNALGRTAREYVDANADRFTVLPASSTLASNVSVEMLNADAAKAMNK